MSSGSALPHQHTALQQQQQQSQDVGTSTSSEQKKMETSLKAMKNEPDGSWKRQVSSLRNWIQEDGEFPAEKGEPECG